MTALILRADADEAMGTGHFMRCLTLASAWRRAEGDAVFVTRCTNAHLLERAAEVGVEVVPMAASDAGEEDARVLTDMAARYRGSVVVVDGYQFDSAYQRAVKSTGYPLMFFDDYIHCDYYVADVVVNPGLTAARENYYCEPHTQLLLGPDYVLIRDEFSVWADWERAIPPVARRVLISLGGSDLENATAKALRALLLAAARDLEVRVVVGASNPNRDELVALSESLPAQVTMLHAVTDMARLMAWADVAIAAGGTTCWELAFMGLPSLLLILADNQVPNATSYHDAGIARTVGVVDAVSPELLAAALQGLLEDADARAAMSRRGRELVDGRGSARLVQVLHSLSR